MILTKMLMKGLYYMLAGPLHVCLILLLDAVRGRRVSVALVSVGVTVGMFLFGIPVIWVCC